MEMMKMMLIAGAGGFVGTCARFLVGKLGASLYVGSFPLGTFLVNVVGCLIIGVLYGLLEKTHVLTPATNVMLITGFCGGFTTFSTFANDAWVLGNRGDWSTLVFYLASSVIIGVALVWVGRILIR